MGADAPYYLFGHSMGSFVTRAYLAAHADGLAGVVICGTGFVEPVVSRAGNFLARIIARICGERAHSKLLHSLADGAYIKQIADPRTQVDWLSFDEANVDAYIADPACGFMFTAAGYAALTDLTARACSPATVAAYPKDLPLFYIAGESDPVGGNGAGVLRSADLARSAGVASVEVKIYPGMRHEILNGAGRTKVYEDVLAFLTNR